jgi:hypothetical protein
MSSTVRDAPGTDSSQPMACKQQPQDGKTCRQAEEKEKAKQQ